MSVYTHPFLPSFLHAILRVTKRRSVTQLLATRLRLNKGRFSATRVSPTACIGWLLGPLSSPFVHFAIVYTPGLVGCLVWTVSFVCSWFTSIRATYTGVHIRWDAYDLASYAAIAMCWSYAGDPCVCFSCAWFAGITHWCSTWRQVCWSLHARCQGGVISFSWAFFVGIIHIHSTWCQVYWSLHARCQWGVISFSCAFSAGETRIRSTWCLASVSLAPWGGIPFKALHSVWGINGLHLKSPERP